MAWPTSNFPANLDTDATMIDRISGDDVIANDINGAYDAIRHIEVKVGIDSSAVATSLDYLLKNSSSSNPGHKHTIANGATDVTIAASAINTFLASGRKLWFYEASAPSGWTIQTPATEALLAVAKTGGIYTTGGTQAGTWTQPDCTLTTANLPAHDHGSAGSHTHTLKGCYQGVSTYAFGLPYEPINDAYDQNIQSSGNHAHTSVGSNTAHNHGTAYRPLASVGIICAKD